MLRSFSILIIIILSVITFLYGNTYSAIVLGVIVVSWVISLAINLLLRRKIRLTMKVDGGARNGYARLLITTYNDGNMPILFFSGKLNVENTFTGEKKTERFTIPVQRRGSNVFEPEMTVSSCGKYTVTISGAGLYDMYGLIKIPVNISEHCSFTVMPSIFDVSVDYDARESNSFDNELYSPYKKGNDRSEVFQIREYEGGDNLGSIHWKLSSKLDKTMVRDASLPLNKELIVALDKSCSSEPSVDECERLAETAVSICQGLIDGGMTYRLIWNNPEIDEIKTKEIQFESDYLDSIHEMMSGKPATSSESLATLYEKMYGSIDTTHVIYVSTDDRIIPESVFRGGLVKRIMTSIPRYRELYNTIEL